MKFLSICLLYWMSALFYFPLVYGESVWKVEWPVDQSFVKQYANSTFRNNRNDITDMSPIFRNKRIMFIGDSLTRYQYLNLIRYLHSGRWSDPLSIQLCCEKTVENWDEFYARLSLTFGCNHICDCHNWKNDGSSNITGTQENHYYYDPDLNLTISSHFWPGIVPMLQKTIQIMPKPKYFQDYCRYLTTSYMKGEPVAATDYTPQWTYPDINSFLEEVVKPSQVDMLIVNFGHWEGALNHHDVFKTEEKVIKFCELATSMVPEVIWKVTTAKQKSPPVDDERFFSYLARYPTIKLFNAYKYTVEVAYPVSMWDSLHYYSFVYRELNIALLEQLTEWYAPKQQQQQQQPTS